MSSECIVIIANDPELNNDLQAIESNLGKRKTAYLSRAMFFDTLALCLRVPHVDVSVYYGPAQSKKRFESMIELFSHEEKDRSVKNKVKNIRLYSQNSKTMIENITNAFIDVFNSGYKRAIMIGAYCMPLSLSLLTAGFILLREKNVVIGPSFSGRYYLFGMSKCLPEVFENVTWESNDFYVRLGENLKASNVIVQELELCYEVYTIDELNQLIGDIECWRSVGDDRTAYHTERFLRSLSNHIIK